MTKYTAYIDATVSHKYTFHAESQEEADKMAQKFVEHPLFYVRFLADFDMQDVRVTEVAEVEGGDEE